MEERGGGRGSRGRRIVLVSTIVALVAAAGVSVVLIRREPARRAKPVSLRVDPALSPVTRMVEGLDDADPARPVGRIATADGIAGDLVRGELIVGVRDPAQLAGLLRRWNGRVVDRVDDAAPGDPVDHLVRVQPPAADLARAVRNLTKVDPELSGVLRASDAETLGLIAVAASESVEHGIEVSLNELSDAEAISNGTSNEAANLPGNAFDWFHFSSGGVHDVGVGAAWQLLEGYGKLGNKVRVMIADGGFNPNADFPLTRKLRKADWGDSNPMSCTGGNPCPWHGTQVTLVAMARHDNGYGIAGPAGPVAELVAYENYLERWTNLRRMKEVVREERPDVVNMSFTYRISLFKAASEAAADRHFKAMINAGAVLVAAAGNDGRNVDQETCGFGECGENTLWIPCESKHVLCVGGTERVSTLRHDDSNYGSDSGDRTVEIYAPYCMYVMKQPQFPQGKDASTGCGTSYSAPFVAGVAALVKAANPSLDPVTIRDVVTATAHPGGVLPEFAYPDAKQRRIDALTAVASALGVTIGPPKVAITAPGPNSAFGVAEWIDLQASATDFAKRSLPVSWHIDGERDPRIKNKKGAASIAPLPAGTHTVTASASDIRGVSGSATVTINVVDQPPVMTIVAPAVGLKPYSTQAIALIGSSGDPDTNQPLSDAEVSWRVTPKGGGGVLFSVQGHIAAIPANHIAPGQYTIVVTGNNGGPAGSATRALEVLAVPPGEHVPNAVIARPGDGQTFDEDATITFQGSGLDQEDGSISGTRFRWVAVSDQGTVKVLCRGSAFPGSGGGGGGFAIEKSCKEFTAKLGLDFDPATPGTTTWSVTLEVADSAGLIGRRTHAVVVTFSEG